MTFGEEMDMLMAAAQAIEPMWPITSLPPEVERLFEEYHRIRAALKTYQNKEQNGT